MATGGVMGADETNELNARREIQEELGINMGVDLFDPSKPDNEKKDYGPAPHDLTFIKAHKFESPTDNFYCNIYLMMYDGPIKIQESELDDVEYWTLQEMYENLFNRSLKITPDSKMCFKELLKNIVIYFK